MSGKSFYVLPNASETEGERLLRLALGTAQSELDDDFKSLIRESLFRIVLPGNLFMLSLGPWSAAYSAAAALNLLVKSWGKTQRRIDLARQYVRNGYEVSIEGDLLVAEKRETVYVPTPDPLPEKVEWPTTGERPPNTDTNLDDLKQNPLSSQWGGRTTEYTIIEPYFNGRVFDLKVIQHRDTKSGDRQSEILLKHAPVGRRLTTRPIDFFSDVKASEYAGWYHWGYCDGACALAEDEILGDHFVLIPSPYSPVGFGRLTRPDIDVVFLHGNASFKLLYSLAS